MKIDAILTQMHAPSGPLAAQSTGNDGFAAVMRQSAELHAMGPASSQVPAAADASTDMAGSLQQALFELLGLPADADEASVVSALEEALSQLPQASLEQLAEQLTARRSESGAITPVAVPMATSDADQHADAVAALQALAALLSDDQRALRTPERRGGAELSAASAATLQPVQPGQRREQIELTADRSAQFADPRLAARESAADGRLQPAGQPWQSATTTLDSGAGQQTASSPVTGIGNAAGGLFSGGMAQAAATQAETVRPALPTPVHSPDWGRDLGQQLVRMTQQGPQQMTLQLHPQELGPLSVDLRVADQVAQLSLLSASPQVRGALEQALPLLRDALAEQGITLEDTHVGDQQPRQHDHNQGRPAHQQQAAADSGTTPEADLLARRNAEATRALEAGRVNLYV